MNVDEINPFAPSSQKQAAFLQSESFFTVYGGAMGSGKAQPLTSKVLTPIGWKLMGDIKVGDLVTTPKNKSSRVVAVYPFDSKSVYRVTTHSGRVTECCDEHLWDVYLSKKKVKSSRSVVDTKHIIDHMELGNRVYLPICDPVGSTVDSDLLIDPYLMGIFISEGGLSQGKAIFTSADKQIVDRISNTVSKDGFHLKPTTNGLTFAVTKNDQDVVRDNKGCFVNTHGMVRDLKELGLAFTKSYTKFIPKCYLESSIEQRFELLRGLMDGDGTVDKKNTCEYSTSSEQLSKDVVNLVRSLGGVAKVTSRYPAYTHNGIKKTGALSFRVYIKFQDTANIFFLDRKIAQTKDRKHDVKDEIISIEFDRYEACQCISIEDENHLYITDDYIVTHNTYQGLLRFLRWWRDPNFVGVVVRKNATFLKQAGGAFDEACDLYKKLDPKCEITKQPMLVKFTTGAKIFFTGYDGQAGKDAFQGIQVSAIMVDEGTQVNEEDILWMMTRLRGKAKMSKNIWITCNPSPDSYLRRWVDWYLFPKEHAFAGRPDPSKNGIERWYLMVNNELIWGMSWQELFDRYHEKMGKNSSGKWNCNPKSFRFIGATCEDNPIMLLHNPDYVGTLLARSPVEVERQYYGNWDVRPEEAGYFKRNWVEMINPSVPKEMEYLKHVTKRVRCYDLAGSIPSESYADPDWTVGVLMARTKFGDFFIEDVVRWRKRSGESIQEIMNVARDDKKRFGNVQLHLPVDPGQAGLTAKMYQAKLFAAEGLSIKFLKVGTTKSKLTRFEPFANAAENGLIKVLRADWNDCYFNELEAFDGVSKKRKDDQIDGTADAFNVLATTKEYKKLNPAMIG